MGAHTEADDHTRTHVHTQTQIHTIVAAKNTDTSKIPTKEEATRQSAYWEN